ncbi:MAG: EamA family transporter [Micromonosporaceae bacterium]|nr:EamA family transporter [Micromonosporaceae bacterium]
MAAAAVTVVLWASAFVSIRSATASYPPGALALGRLLVASAVLGAILLIRREGWPSRAAWPGIAASGVLWFGVYMVALNWGEQGVDAGTASMVVGIGPLLVALLGGWLLKEGLPGRLLAGMAVSFAGVIVVGFSMSDGGRASVLGVLLCLVAAVALAGGVVSQKPALRHASPWQATGFGCMVGAIACLPFAGQLVSGVAEAPLSATANMVYLGLFPTALAFLTWAYALTHSTTGKMAATTYAIPAVAVLLSWAFLGEVPGLLTLAGGAVCVAGVAVARRTDNSKGKTTDAEPTGGAGQDEPAGRDEPEMSAAETASPQAAKDQR